MTNANDSAFATHPGQSNGLHGEEWQVNLGQPGLTKREYFAAQAMNGILSNIASFGIQSVDEAIDRALKWADVLIEKLNEEQKR